MKIIKEQGKPVSSKQKMLSDAITTHISLGVLRFAVQCGTCRAGAKATPASKRLGLPQNPNFKLQANIDTDLWIEQTQPPAHPTTLPSSHTPANQHPHPHPHTWTVLTDRFMSCWMHEVMMKMVMQNEDDINNFGTTCAICQTPGMANGNR